MECQEDASDETLDVVACQCAYFEGQNNCTLPWRRELNQNHAVCHNKSQFDSFRNYFGEINKMNVQEISKLTGCLQACKRTEFKSKNMGEFVRYMNNTKTNLPTVGKY